MAILTPAFAANPAPTPLKEVTVTATSDALAVVLGPMLVVGSGAWRQGRAASCASPGAAS